MINRITKKEYDREMERRKHAPTITRLEKRNKLYFKGEDGRYYICDQTGGAGLKEIWQFNRNFKRGIEDQTSLI